MLYARLVANPRREPGEDDGDDDRLDIGVASFLATCDVKTKYLLACARL